MGIDVDVLQAKRALYMQGLTTARAQAEAARQQYEGLTRQIAIQEGAVAAVDEMLALMDGQQVDGQQVDKDVDGGGRGGV